MNTTTLLVSSSLVHTRLALLQQRNLLEFRLVYDSQIGNIYKGVVLDIHKNLGLAFIDFGEKAPGLLSLPPSFWTRPPFQKGSCLMVQVSRDKMCNLSTIDSKVKNLRFTRDLSFLTPFFTFFLHSPGLKFSNFSPRSSFKESFLQNFSHLLLKEEGALLNPLAYHTSFEILRSVLQELRELFVKLAQKNEASKPGLLFQAQNFLFRYILHHSSSLKKIIADDFRVYKNITSFLEKTHLAPFILLEHHKSLTQGPLFESYDIEESWDSLRDPLIPLSSGHLILEKTSAFWTFDVNSASLMPPQKPLSPFELNRLAGIKILQEIRLKNLGGTSVVDFVPLSSWPLRQKLLKCLQTKALEDPIQTHVHHISPLGICEITRLKIEPSLLDLTSEES